ncbi:MAG TPA: hypothetical protein ENN66_00635 [Proteobacteria bacterium]|jgi:hypothetical protein|nr:hypothetical protein [Pseudomonadota bacterium]
MKPTMYNFGSEGRLEVSFTFQPRNKRGQSDSRRGSTGKGNIPRVAKLLALAIRFEKLVKRGDIQDYADLARLGYVTRARITQIMNLLNLAPNIQEDILFLPNTMKGRDPILEKDLRPVAAVPHWNRQRKMWAQMRKDRLG